MPGVTTFEKDDMEAVAVTVQFAQGGFAIRGYDAHDERLNGDKGSKLRSSLSAPMAWAALLTFETSRS